MSNKSEQDSQQYNGQLIGICFIVVVTILWLGLRSHTSTGLKAYNDCYLQASQETENIRRQTLEAGYNKSETDSAALDIMTSKADYCYKERPSDFLIWITGAE